jgi:hypothetical protein
LGWKTIETRTHSRFASLAGKRIGIHAAVRWDESAFDAAAPYLSSQRMVASRNFLRCGGGIICIATVRGVDWLTEKDSGQALIDCSTVRRFGLFLTDVETIPAVGCKGRQGIWYYDVLSKEPA